MSNMSAETNFYKSYRMVAIIRVTIWVILLVILWLIIRVTLWIILWVISC